MAFIGGKPSNLAMKLPAIHHKALLYLALLLQISHASVVGMVGSIPGILGAIMGAAVTPGGLNTSEFLMASHAALLAAGSDSGPGIAMTTSVKALEDAVLDILNDPMMARNEYCNSYSHRNAVVHIQRCEFFQCCLSDRRGTSLAKSIGEDCVMQQLVTQVWGDPILLRQACDLQGPDNPECRLVRCCLGVSTSNGDGMAAVRNCFLGMHGGGYWLSFEEWERTIQATLVATILSGLSLVFSGIVWLGMIRKYKDADSQPKFT